MLMSMPIANANGNSENESAGVLKLSTVGDYEQRIVRRRNVGRIIIVSQGGGGVGGDLLSVR